MSKRSRRISHAEEAFSRTERQLAGEPDAGPEADSSVAIQRMIQYGQNKMK